MVYFIAVIISIFVGGFLGYQYGGKVEDKVYADLQKAKDELAKLKSKV